MKVVLVMSNPLVNTHGRIVGRFLPSPGIRSSTKKPGTRSPSELQSFCVEKLGNHRRGSSDGWAWTESSGDRKRSDGPPRMVHSRGTILPEENARGQWKARIHLKYLLFCKQLIYSLSVPFSWNIFYFSWEQNFGDTLCKACGYRV